METIEVNKLIPHARNNEFFDDIHGDNWKEFLESVKTSGVIEPIVITQDKVIVSGHQRVRACEELDIEAVPYRLQLYEDSSRWLKEDMILKNLLETNLRQRGIGNTNSMKFARCIQELERLYGVVKGNNQWSGDNLLSQTQMAENLGIGDRQLRDYKKLLTLIPELQDLVETDQLSATTAYKVWAKLSPDEQEKMFQDIGKDKISELTQKQTEQLVKEKTLLEQEKNQLQSKLKEQINLQDEIELLKMELEERPTIEKAPKDYEELKQKIKDSDGYYNKLKREYDVKVEKMGELEKQIKSMVDISPEQQHSKKLKDDAILFCAKVENFISQVGGLAYLAGNIAELPPNEKKAYIKTVELVEQWAFAIKANLKMYL